MTIGKSFDRAGAVVFSITGKFSGATLYELRREIEVVQRAHKEIVIDMSEVTLVDRPCLQFLARRQHIRLVNCPEYIQPWIGRESY